MDHLNPMQTRPPAPVGPQAGHDPSLPDGPIHPGSGRRSLRSRLAAPFAALLALLAKAKTIIFLLPKLKLLTTAGTMLISIAAYSLFFGWTFAIGFVLLLLVHEMGHVIQLRREGVNAS